MLPLLDAFDLTPVFAALIEFPRVAQGRTGAVASDEVNTALPVAHRPAPRRRRVRERWILMP